MARQLSVNASGNLTFQEEVFDIDGDNIQLDTVELHSIDGAPPPSKNPSWLSWQTSQQLDNDGTRRRFVDVTLIPNDLEEGRQYRFRFVASDPYASAEHFVVLDVGELIPAYSQVLEWDQNTLQYTNTDGTAGPHSRLLNNGNRDIGIDRSNEQLYHLDDITLEIIRMPFDLSSETVTGTLSGVNLGNAGVAYDPSSGYIFFHDDSSREIVKVKPDGSDQTIVTSSANLRNLRAHLHIFDGRLYSSGYDHLWSYAIAGDGSLSDEQKHFTDSGSGGGDIVRFGVDTVNMVAYCTSANDGLYSIDVSTTGNSKTILDASATEHGAVVDPANQEVWYYRDDGAQIWLTKWNIGAGSYTQVATALGGTAAWLVGGFNL